MANYLTTLRGTLASGSLTEIFSHSLAIVSSAEPSNVATAVATAWDGVWKDPTGAISNMWPASVTYVEATCAAILDLKLGKLMAAHHVALPLGSIGTDVSGAIPSQASVAVSLVAGTRANGAPLKGRFYLPGPARAAMETTNGFLTAAAQGQILAAMNGFHDALQVAGHHPSVWSRTEGKLNGITMIRVGNKVDTIRRRRNAGAEIYVDSPQTPGVPD